MIPVYFFSDNRHFLDRLTGESHSWLTEINKQNDMKTNFPKIGEVKYIERLYMLSVGSFSSILRTEQLNSGNMKTARYVSTKRPD